MNKKVGMKLENVTDKNITPEIDEEKIQRMFGEQEELLKFLSEFEVDEEVFAKVVLERDALKFLYREYKDLEEQGLLLRLPCKVGDTLYHVLACTTAEDFGKKYVDWFIVTHLLVDTTKEVDIMGRDICNKEWGVNSRGIGKTIFLTREEAEQKLKEMKG